MEDNNSIYDMGKNMSSKGVAVAVVCSLVILIVAICIGFSLYKSSSKKPNIVKAIRNPKKTITLNSQYGAAKHPDYPLYRYWDEKEIGSDTRFCDSGKYGKNCDIEKYDDNFVAMGDSIVLDKPIKTFSTENLSFSQDSCTSVCMDTPRCVMVSYEDKVCSLYKQDSRVDLGGFSHNEQSLTYYMKDRDAFISNRIYLFDSESRSKGRFWLTANGIDSSYLRPGEVKEISFFPVVSKCSSGLTGYYSTNKNNVENCIEGRNLYIHKPGRPLKIPNIWKGKILYVMYR